MRISHSRYAACNAKERREARMKNYSSIRVLMYLLVSLALTLTSCGGESGGIPPHNRGVGQVRQVSEATAVLRGISISPNNPLGINSGTRLQFTATGSFSDNSVQDLTMMMAWTSSDTSVATVSNALGSIGLVTAVSRGYCSISATLGNISGSVIIGVN
jgi:hypothetical protein